MSQEQPPQEQVTQEKQGAARPQKPAWIVGGVLIVVGIVFLIRPFTGLVFDNWWALFILIPAIGSLVTSYQMYQRNGRRFTNASRGPLVGGVLLLGVTAVFLFNLDWGVVWPAFVIILGLGILFSALERKP